MYIKDYRTFTLQLFTKSEQFTKITGLLEKYGLTTYSGEWFNIEHKYYRSSEILNISIITDVLFEMSLIPDEIIETIYDLLNNFANILFENLRINRGFDKVKTTNNKAIIAKQSGEIIEGVLLKVDSDNETHIQMIINDL